MKEITLESIDVGKRESSEQLLVNLIRAKYPHLDLRRGTALRDLLVIPDAIIHAWFSENADELRAVSSLQVLLERADAGESIDTEDVDRILSNFNLSGAAGNAASGSVRVVVSSPRRYSVPAGFVFKTMTGLEFKTTQAFYADEYPSSGEIKLFKGSANYYFIIPVVCSTVGQAGNIDSGTVLSISTALPGFVTATAYDVFSGGSDVEDLESIKARIPVALSNRGLLTASSVEAVIRDRFDSSSNPVVAVSVVGYGNRAQLRDRHNPFGIGVGGRVDVYVRNFTTPYVDVEQVHFTYNAKSGEYEAVLEVPGMYAVKSVNDPSDAPSSSYTYSTEYTVPDGIPRGHDIEGSNELAGTVWRACKIRVKCDNTDELEKVFSVSTVCLPSAMSIQDYLDDITVRNVGCDYVVRCPAVCTVTMNIVCRYKLGTSFDVQAAKAALVNYVNTSGFVGRLTRSEIACVLRGVGARSIDITDDYMLTGVVVDSSGTSRMLSGDALDIDDIEDPDHLLTRDTCVFATTTGNINLIATPV